MELFVDQPSVRLFIFLLYLSRSLFLLGFYRFFLRFLLAVSAFAHDFFPFDLGSLVKVNMRRWLFINNQNRESGLSIKSVKGISPP